MNKDLIGYMVTVFMVTVFVYVGIAIILNIHDELMGTNYAYWFNFVGWCSAIFIGVSGFIWYLKLRKNLIVR